MALVAVPRAGDRSLCPAHERGRPPKVSFAPDSPLEEAVTSELVSESQIPVQQGKIQGISSILTPHTRFEGRNDHSNQRPTGKFPTQRNRELIGPYQGIKSAYQGSFLVDQGRALVGISLTYGGHQEGDAWCSDRSVPTASARASSNRRRRSAESSIR
jgi:hypothetical protein